VATSKLDAAIDAAEHISGVDFLQVEGDPFAAGAGADKGAEPQIAAKRAIDAHRAASLSAGEGASRSFAI